MARLQLFLIQKYSLIIRFVHRRWISTVLCIFSIHSNQIIDRISPRYPRNQRRGVWCCSVLPFSTGSAISLQHRHISAAAILRKVQSKNQPPTSLLQPRLIVVFDACIVTTILRGFYRFGGKVLASKCIIVHQMTLTHPSITIHVFIALCKANKAIKNANNSLQSTRKIRRHYYGV